MSRAKVVSLCLIATFCLTALSSDHALATPEWMSPPLIEAAEVSGKVEKELVLLTKTGLTTVEVHCPAIKFVGGLLEREGAASGKLHYEGCTTKLNKGATSAICAPHSEGSAKDGLIETNALHGQIELHEGKVSLIKLTPASGEVFVKLIFGKVAGSECSIKKFDVTGTLFAKDANDELEVEADTHLFEASTALGGLLFGVNAATVDGSVQVDPPELGPWNGLGA